MSDANSGVSGAVATAAVPPTPMKRGIAGNSVLNLMGQGIPLVAAFFAFPKLIQGLGADRFGVLTLAWMVIGYFSLFDLGLGRALTQVLAARLGESPSPVSPPIVWPALGLMFATGCVGALLVAGMTPTLVYSLLRIPAGLQEETLISFYVLAAAIPVVVVTTGLAGVLAAFDRFVVLNAIRAPMGAFTFLAPVAVLPFSRSLVVVTVALAVGRVAAMVAHAIACRRLLPPMSSGREGMRDVSVLYRFGAWMTVSNIVGPLMLYLDRFVIGSTMTVAAVAFYATPYEMVTKLLIVPGAVLGVLFPAFAASFGSGDRQQLDAALLRGTRLIGLLLLPVLLLITAFAPEGLSVWLGAEFAAQSSAVLRCMAVGVFINAIAQVFASVIQAAGRPSITARLHLAELPLYLVMLWWMIGRYGILGAALAWTVRAALDGALLVLLARPMLGAGNDVARSVAGAVLSAVGVLLLPTVVGPVAPRAGLVLVLFLVLAVVVWHRVLDGSERTAIRSRWRKVGFGTA